MTQVTEFLSEIEWQKWQTSHKLFVLLDCAQLSSEDSSAFQSLDPNVCVGLFKGSPDDGLKAVEPMLLDPLNISTSHGMSWLLQSEKDNPMLIWLVSDASMSELARQFRSLLSADLPGAPNALLRYYDPRVFQKLMQVMDTDQKSLFFTNAQQWWAWHKPSGKRQTYIAPTAKVQPVEKIILSALQMQALNKMDLDDFVKNTKTDMVRNKKDRLHTRHLSDADVERYVGEHINKAIAFGFESEEAVLEYLQHVAATLGWTFEEKNLGGVVSTLQDENLTEDEKLAFLKNARTTVLI
jgi:hypothetical protein